MWIERECKTPGKRWGNVVCPKRKGVPEEKRVRGPRDGSGGPYWEGTAGFHQSPAAAMGTEWSNSESPRALASCITAHLTKGYDLSDKM